MNAHWLDGNAATTFEIADFLERIPAAILPFGATEQHGPHLPVTTDTLLAQEFAARIAERSCGVVFPAISLGYSWVWRDRPGTLTVRFDTFQAIVRDLVHGLERQGVRAALLFTSHLANVHPLKYLARELVDESGVALLYMNYPNVREIIGGELRSPMWGSGAFHADEIETAWMLATHPELVRMEHAVSEYPPIPPTYEYDTIPMGSLSHSGVFGDATVADAGNGRRWMDALADEMAGLWRTFLADRRIYPTDAAESPDLQF